MCLLRRHLCLSSRVGCRLLVLLWFVVVISLLYHAARRGGCGKRPFGYRDELEDSTQAVGQVLDSLQLRHFLCYGSLWGQVHERRNPPWEADAELCVLRELSGDDVHDSLISSLDKAGFSAELDHRLGRYDVYRADGTPGLVQLVLFAPDTENKMYRRDGWEHRGLGADCGSAEAALHCFPARLVAPPLERRPFGEHRLPVPWKGFELQKYLFVDTWYRDYRASC